VSHPQPEIIVAPNRSLMTLDGTRTYVVGHRRPVVIDPGPSIDSHVRALHDRLRGARPLAVVVTHGHADHAGAAVELARSLGSPLWMAPGALSGTIPGTEVDRWCADGDRLETDGGVLDVLLTPGHAPEHISLHWSGCPGSAGDSIFVGDLLLGRGDTTLIAPPEGNVSQYLASLDRLESIGAGLLYPAHGPALTDAKRAIGRYRAHRHLRIDRLRAILQEDPQPSLDLLVDRLYGEGLPNPVREAAGASIRAMLIFIHGEPR
jgi:glyoxylase-like metal-dependent hydrolase (beta-lactamase superfamily II)